MNKREALAAGRALILAQARSSWIPQVAKESEGVSQYFGSPWLADTEEWPVILEKPAQFVLQFDLAMLPVAIQSFMGNKGLLQFFYQPDDSIEIDWELGTSQLSLVRLVNPAGTIGGPRQQPKVSGYKSPKAKYIVAWNERLDYPHTEEYQELGFATKLDQMAEEHGIYDEDFAGTKYFALQGDKLGGWPFWTQALEYPIDSRGDRMRLLYQVDAGSFYDSPHVKAYAKNLFAGDGTGHIFVSQNNPEELRFEWACG